MRSGLFFLTFCVLATVYASEYETVGVEEIFWNNLTSSELNKLSPKDFETVTLEQISVIPADACQGFTRDQMAALNPNAVSCAVLRDSTKKVPGFSAAQVSNFPDSACFSITSSQMPNFRNVTFGEGGFKWSCLSSLPSTSVGVITANQISSITPLLAAKITGSWIIKLPTSAFAGFTAAQVATFDNTCSYLKQDFFHFIPAETYSGFTGGCISQVPNDAFTGFYANGLARLSSDAVSKITISSMTKISQDAAAGFTADQVQAISLGCAGVSPSIFAGMPGTSYAGWRKGCINQIPSHSFAGVYLDGVSNFTASELAGLQDSQLRQIPLGAVAGFTAAHISFFSTACPGISADFFHAITGPSYAGFTRDCLFHVSSTSFGGCYKEGVSAFTTSAISGISEYAMKSITKEAAGGFTVDQVKSFSTGTSSGCTGVTANIFSGLQPGAYAGFTRDCLVTVGSEAFSGCYAAGVSNFSTQAISGIAQYGMKKISQEAAAGFTKDQVANFSTGPVGGCTGVSADIMSGMAPAAYGGWTADCLGHVPSDAFAGCNATQVAQFNATSVKGIGQYGMFKITKEAAAGFTKDQVANFGSGITGGCTGITPNVMSGITPAAYGGWTADCLSSVPSDAFAGCRAVQVAEFSVAAVKGIGQYGMFKITKDAAAGFTKDQVANFSSGLTGGCTGVTANVMSGMAPAAYGGWTANCLDSVPSDAFAGCNSSQVAQFNATSVKGIGQYGMFKITQEAAAGFTKEQVSNFGPGITGGCSGVTANIFTGMTGTAYSGFLKNCISSIPSASFAAATFVGIGNISASEISGIGQYQMNLIPPSSTAALSEAQIQKLSNDGCSGITGSQLKAITATAYVGFTANCINNIPALSVVGIIPEKVPSLTNNACSGFSVYQVPKLLNDTLLAFTLTQLGSFSGEGVSGISAPQLYILYQKWQKSFVTLYATKQWTFYASTAAGWKSYFLNATVTPIYKTVGDIGVGGLDNVTWIEVSLLQDDISAILTSETVKNLYDLSIAGLRVGQVPYLVPTTIEAISDTLSSSIIYDTLLAFNRTQLESLTPVAFSTLRDDTLFRGIEGNNMEWITEKQIAALATARPDVFQKMPCEQVLNITGAQRTAISKTPASKSFEKRDNYCKHAPPGPEPTPGPGPEPTPGPGPTPGPNPLSPGVIAGIAVGGVVAVAIVVFAVFYFNKRRMAYQAI